MAIIQNAAVIQKLIDELELSPALEKIPTELAEKILPVFQVNETDVNVTLKGDWEAKHETASTHTLTITVPDNETWTIRSMFVKYTCAAVVDNRFFEVIVSNSGGNQLARFAHDSAMTSGQVWGYDFIEGTAIDGTTCASYFYRFVNFIKDLKLPEKCTIKIWDSGTKQAGDSIIADLVVDVQSAA